MSQKREVKKALAFPGDTSHSPVASRLPSFCPESASAFSAFALLPLSLLFSPFLSSLGDLLETSGGASC